MWDKPRPCDFCPLEHALTFFPDCLPGATENYPFYAITRKHLCKPLAQSEIGCDPAICEKRFRGSAHRGQIFYATKDLWKTYYGETYEASAGYTVGEAFTDILDDLDL